MTKHSREWKLLDDHTRSIIGRRQDDGPVNVGAIAADLGVTVKVANLGPGISGQISREDGRYVIRVNRFETKERQRFTVAHELAHYLLHREIIDKTKDGIRDNVLYRSGAGEQIEFQANRLAADILLPTAAVQAKLSELGNRITEIAIDALADHFRVSKSAMEVRLSQLDNNMVAA